MKLTKQQNIVIALVLIAIGAICRLLPHWPNFTPLGAIALLGGAYISKKHLAVILPLAILFISDLIINNTLSRAFFPDVQGMVIWQPYMWYVYIGFAFTVGVGMFYHKLNSFGGMLVLSIAAAVVFFLVTNFGMWAQGILYPDTPAGLLAAYTAGLPFLLNSIAGNIFFVAIFFGAYHFVAKYRTANQMIGA